MPHSKQANHRNKTFTILTLGCPKNLVDSETLAGTLTSANWRYSQNLENSLVVILNTCAFIPPARAEAFHHLERLIHLKQKGVFKFLVLAGCLPLYLRKTPRELPANVDLFLTPPQYPDAPSLLETLCEKHLSPSPQEIQAINSSPDDSSRLILSPAHYSYIRISDGCSNHCSFCTIPFIRGRHRPKPASDILAEAELLAACGAKELIIIAQDTTAYHSPDTKEDLAFLLKQLARNTSFQWIRLMYTHPAKITSKLVEVLATEKKIVKYIDLPVQHINNRILRLMRREGSSKAIRKAITLLRNSIPDIVIRTSLIVGFPTETEDEFKELKEFVEEARFERLGVFPYYPEPSTLAAKLPQLPRTLIEERLQTIMQIQKKIAFSYTKTLVGRTETVLVDFATKEFLLARTYRDAPQIDAVCKIVPSPPQKKGKSHQIGEFVGEFVKVCFIKTHGYDIIAETRQYYEEESLCE
ncbi:MAG: 30S ribosomal protein S12 methylthiotransferase RimO [Planctomycetota bacterium]|nr:30S ribosomal protein S12 methylthiotransferase RimO [Planctomycetota bacterium]